MTQSTPTPGAPGEGVSGGGRLVGGGRPLDAVLQLFAKLAHDNEDLELSLTVSVSGSIFSGLLVGRKAWLTRLSSLFTAQTAEDGTWIDQVGLLLDRLEGDREPQLGDFSWLHMVDTQVVVGDRMIPVNREGGLWRVTVEEVDAWALGRMAEG